MAIADSPARASSGPLRRHWFSILGVLLVLAALKVGTAVMGMTGAVVGALATLGVLAVTRAGRLDWHELGISRHALKRGSVWALGVFGLVAVGFAVTAVVARVAPPVAAWVTNLQVSVPDPRMVALQALVTIPIGTVLVEEVAFRSALPALFGKVGASTRTAVVASAALFGLWHVVPSLDVALERSGSSTPVWLVVGGTVLFTTASGLVLGWLRIISRSLLPPIAVHLATNSLGVGLLWFLAMS